MTAIDSAQTQTVESALVRMASATDEHELEAAWVAGLRGLRDPDDRHRILAAAGRRMHVFDEVVDDLLRRHWLEDVVHEVRVRGGRPLGEKLAAVMMTEVREAFARADADLAALRKAVAAGHGMHDFSAQSPLAAARLCDLGRMAERLRGTELMALVPAEDARLARELADSWAFRNRLLVAVPAPLRVDRDDLLDWARSRAAESELPRLLRMLVAETAHATKIDFPAGTSVAASGWDGIVECFEGNQFVPEGRSGWEVSTQQSGSDAKAQSDYRNRIEDVAPEQRHDMDYVAVLCAPWTKARAFEQEKRSLCDFRSVRALNVDALESWLECAPHSTVWLRELMGKPVVGINLLSAWWAKWLESTSPALDAGVVLAGRDDQAVRLRDRCQLLRGGVITIGGQIHRDEVLAFVAAALVSPDGPSPCSTDALYVDDHDTVKSLLAAEVLSVSSPRAPALTVVVPSADFAEHLPAGSRHRMIVPVPGGSQAEIVLEAADSAVVAGRLRAAGADSDDAHELGSLARMSLMALRRHLAVSPEVHRPQWATGPVAETLRRSLLLNSWDQSRAGDREVVERFVGRSHEDTAETLNNLDSGDAPMILTGEIRHVVSPTDTWMLLDHHLTPADIEALGEVVHDVLTEPDPLYGTTGLERLQAQYDCVRAKYSSWIKRGVATTLALLGSRHPTLLGSASPASTAASGIVWRILRSANEDASPRTWDAVVEVLPLLAEANPEAVLSSLRTCLSERQAFAEAMFEDGSDDGFGFPAPSAHLRVLEALEFLAWSPDHVEAAVDMLAGLAAIDPGGGWANRPAGSLASIMCPGSPNTCASIQERLEAIAMLRKRHGPVAWKLMLSMLPNEHRVQFHKSGPHYRDWKRAEPVVTPAEQADVVAATADMLLQDVGDDPKRWAALIGRVTGLPDIARSEMIAALRQVVDAGPDEEFKSLVWPTLREMVDRHREFHNTQWALPETEIASFDALAECLRPMAPEIAYGQLFSSGLTFIDGASVVGDRRAYEEAVAVRQDEATGAILHSGGVSAVLEFAERIEQPGMVGDSLARRGENLDEAVLGAMPDAPPAITCVALRYFECRFAEFGWEGVDRLLADHGLSPQVAADLLRAVPAAELPWRRVDALGHEVAAEYWTRVGCYETGPPTELSELVEVSRRLREAGRIDMARTVLVHQPGSFESELDFAEEAAACLDLWVLQEADGKPAYGAMVAWELTSLIKALDQHREHLGTERVARIEWLYFPLLGHGPDFKAPNLYREMVRSPEFFAWMVELAYKPASASLGEEWAPSEEQRRMAVNAHDVLHSWPASTFAPGLDGEGRVDAGLLDEWIDRTRERVTEIDRVQIGHTMIGAALAASLPDPNDEWPSTAVRDLIERLQNDDLEKGLAVAIFTQRGITSRSPTSGGAQERQLANAYKERSKRLSAWPRTAAIFAGLASDYTHIAETYDREAEANRRGLPL